MKLNKVTKYILVIAIVLLFSTITILISFGKSSKTTSVEPTTASEESNTQSSTDNNSEKYSFDVENIDVLKTYIKPKSGEISLINDLLKFEFSKEYKQNMGVLIDENSILMTSKNLTMKICDSNTKKYICTATLDLDFYTVELTK